ncbi:MAG: DUF1801 domain-containing protein [Planctomycetes bacterium]|nr:DUF1801 domain-containing protein [Planctomycetota bacterium]
MQSKSATVSEYLAALPPDRRATLEAVRKVIKANLDGYEEGMQYGMIGYYVPHKAFPAGYHCDPKQPLPFGGLASQKQKCSLYLMGLYIGDGGSELTRWFLDAWKQTGKKLDMGKACIRFKDVDDLALDVIGEAIRRMPSKTYIANYLAVLGSRTPKSRAQITADTARAKAERAAKAAAKPVAKKSAPKKAATKTSSKR